MPALIWDAVGERRYETGVDHGVLYFPVAGVYSTGFAWNGLTTVTESPSGAEATAMYADNIKYLNLQSAEDFSCTIEAFTYPDEFEVCNGAVSPAAGVTINQQTRVPFGFSYRSLLGNDTDGQDHGYKLHLVYGCLAGPSEKAYTTVNDSPEAMTLSWEISTTAVAVTGHKPTASLTVDSTTMAPADLAALEAILYGAGAVAPKLPLPDEVIALVGTGGGGG